METSTCRSCVHAISITTDAVRCAPPEAPLIHGEAACAAWASAPQVALVREDVPGPAVLDWSSAASPGTLVVVDERERFIGFVSTRSIARPRWPWSLPTSLLAGDLATGRALFVEETTPIGEAVRTMAARGARSLALIGDDGAVRGVLSDIAALAELARTRRTG